VKLTGIVTSSLLDALRRDFALDWYGGSTVRDIGGAYDPLGYGLVARPVLTLPLRQFNHRARLTAASATFALKAEP
jgi:hypothetical protein